MKKNVLILGIMLFTAGILFGEITDCEITATTSEYNPDTTVDLEFHLNYSSSDYEYLDGAYLDFPSDVTVNSAEDIGNLTCNGETGDGVQVTWGSITGHSELGPQNADADFSVNVTINAGFSGDMDIDWFINGDGYAGEPHTVSGTATISQEIAGAPGDPTNPSPADEATVVSVTADLSWTNGANTDNVDVYFSTTESEVTNKEASARVITGQNVQTYDSGTMTYDTKFFWRVIAKNSNKFETDGPVWKFTAEYQPTAVPWTEGFETIAAAGDWTGGWDHDGRWETYTSSNTYNRQPRTGSNFASCMCDADDWAYTCPITLEASKTYNFFGT